MGRYLSKYPFDYITWKQTVPFLTLFFFVITKAAKKLKGRWLPLGLGVFDSSVWTAWLIPHGHSG